MGAASTLCTDCVVSETCTGMSAPVPVARGLPGETVATVDTCDWLPLPDEDCELEAAGPGPTVVTVPGVVVLVGRIIVTASPTLTVGRLGLSGTLNTRVVVVTV